MTTQEIKDLIASKIAGQGSAVDTGSALPEILNGIVDALENATSKLYAVGDLRRGYSSLWNKTDGGVTPMALNKSIDAIPIPLINDDGEIPRPQDIPETTIEALQHAVSNEWWHFVVLTRQDDPDNVSSGIRIIAKAGVSIYFFDPMDGEIKSISIQ